LEGELRSNEIEEQRQRRRRRRRREEENSPFEIGSHFHWRACK